MIGDNIVANFVSVWYERGGHQTCFGEAVTLLLSSPREVYYTFFPCLQQSSLPSVAAQKEKEIVEKQKLLRRIMHILIWMANLVSSLLASTIFFTYTQGSPLAMGLSHRLLFNCQ